MHVLCAYPPVARKAYQAPVPRFSWSREKIRQKYVSEMTEDCDTNIQGVIIWLGTTSERAARRRADQVIDYCNAGMKVLARKKRREGSSHGI